MKLTFLGATDTVTGSKYLLENFDKKVLIDCGLFQGYKKLRERNWQKLPIIPSKLDAVFLTHAHIDHSGYIPLLVKNGFRKKIYATQATFELCKVLLPDSGYLHEEEANRANKYGYARHKPCLPLYTKKDAIKSLDFFKVCKLGEPIWLSDDFCFTYSRAGHILGASMIYVKNDSTSILFSGDLGRLKDPIMPPPANIQQADYLVVESTYGNRKHENIPVENKLKDIILKTIKRGGSIIIPAFAVGRAQTILYYLHKLIINDDIPKIPIYVDSPMSEAATEIFEKLSKEHKLSTRHAEEICKIAKYIQTQEESKALNGIGYPSIIISASGMISGGRVLHHIKNLAPDSRNTILFTGFQAGGTRGSKILSGIKEVKIHNNYVPIKAEVQYLSNLSAHADSNEILTWLENFKNPPRKVYITHGEPDSSDSLRIKIKEKFGWNCIVPDYLQIENL